MNDTHQGLMELAREAQRAASARKAHDVDRIAIIMLTELALHLDDERLLLIKLDAGDPEVATDLRRRQRQVIQRLLDLADESSSAKGECHCQKVADEIVVLLGQEVAREELVMRERELPSTSARGSTGVRRYSAEQ